MRRPATSDLLWVVVPPLLLAGLGLAHPMDLTPDSAGWWRNLHVVLLPIFPLLAAAPWIVVRDEHRALRWLVAVLGFTYAVCYTALDVLAGIGAGALQAAGAQHEWPSVMFDQGNDVSTYGVWAYLAAAVLAGAVALLRAGATSVLGAVIVVGAAVSFLGSHIYWPDGVLTMIALAVGWAALVVAMANRSAPVPAGAVG
jgi:hypothetical protein